MTKVSPGVYVYVRLYLPEKDHHSKMDTTNLVDVLAKLLEKDAVRTKVFTLYL